LLLPWARRRAVGRLVFADLADALDLPGGDLQAAALRAVPRSARRVTLSRILAETARNHMFWWSPNPDRNSMRKIGYCKVSSSHQNLDRQIGALRAEGVDVIFREKASGKSVKNRPELERAIDQLGTRDVLIVPEWDRATKSMFDGIEIIKRIHDRGALIKVLDKPHLDLTTPLARGFIAFLSAMAEDERQRIVKRANDGRKVARAKVVRFGRKPKLTDHQQAEALKRLAAGESCRSIVRTMAVHHATVASLAG
jgi:DNA invertase Pin-like site-specific DNA recombinase